MFQQSTTFPLSTPGPWVTGEGPVGLNLEMQGDHDDLAIVVFGCDGKTVADCTENNSDNQRPGLDRTTDIAVLCIKRTKPAPAL